MRAHFAFVVMVLAFAATSARAEKKAKLDLWDGWGTPTGFVISGVVAADRGDHVLGANASPLASFVDDTIVHTYVTDKKKMIGAVLLKNGDTSDPIKGASTAFAKSGAAGFFYVSASPVQFHGRLVEFLKAHGFPRGAVLLKRFGHDSI